MTPNAMPRKSAPVRKVVRTGGSQAVCDYIRPDGSACTCEGVKHAFVESQAQPGDGRCPEGCGVDAMKLRSPNHIELSVANLKALVAEVERKQAAGENVQTALHRVTGGKFVVLTVVSDEEHYSEQELADRLSPYLPPEAWAGVR